MKSGFEHSDARLKQKLDGAQMTPPADAWDSIAAGIAPTKPSIWRWLAPLLILLFIGGTTAFLLLRNDSPAHGNQIASNQTSTTHTNNRIPNNKNRNNTSVSDQHTERSDIEQSKEMRNEMSNATSQVSLQPSNKQNNNSLDLNPSTESSTSNRQDRLTSGNDEISTRNESSEESTSVAQQSDEQEATHNFLAETNSSQTSGTEQSNVTQEQLTNSNDNSITYPIFNSPDYLKTNPTSPIAFGYSTQRSPTMKVLPEKKDFARGFSIDAGIGANTFRVQPTSNTLDSIKTVLKSKLNKEFELGVYTQINYNLNKNWGVHAGIEMYRRKSTTSFTTGDAVITVTLDTIGWYYDSVQQQQLPLLDTVINTETYLNEIVNTNSSTIISIPFGASYSTSIGNRSDLTFALSGVYSLITYKQGFAISDKYGNISPTSVAYRASNILSSRLAIRYSYALDPRFKVYIEPWAGIGLNNFSKGLAYETRLNHAGVKLGLRYQF